MDKLEGARLEELRAMFPILSRQGRGQGLPLAYLDWAATSQKPECVLETERRFYELSNGAVHRGTHLLADESSELYEEARAALAAFVGAHPSQIVWTKNATEALNLVAYALSNPLCDAGRGGLAHLSIGQGKTRAALIGPGDRIVATRLEHHANLVPWQLLAQRTGAEFAYLDLTPQGELDLQTLERITPNTKVVAFSHVSNVTGGISPVEQIVARARSVGAMTVLDTCQSAAHMRLDLESLGVDFACFSAHKMYGPTGIGALYARGELLQSLPPVLSGGSMIADVDMDSILFQDAPTRFEAGTQPVAQAVAWAQALRFISAVGWENIEARERSLTTFLLESLLEVKGLRVLGSVDPARRAGLVSFTLEGVHPHDIGQYLDSRDVAIRVGHHCALPLHKFFGVRASARASLSFLNTRAEIERLSEALRQTGEFFSL